MDDFMKLWREFVLGTKSLAYQLGKNGQTPFYMKECERFFQKIVGPMDRAWLGLTKEEKEGFSGKLEN